MSVSLINGHIDDEMTDEQIIKALECCLGYSCSGCPCEKGASILCLDDLHRYALDLINRQKAEIERLRENIVWYRETGFKPMINVKEMVGETDA